MLVNFVSVSRVRESRTHGLIRGGCRKAVAYFLTGKGQGRVSRKSTAELSMRTTGIKSVSS